MRAAAGAVTTAAAGAAAASTRCRVGNLQVCRRLVAGKQSIMTWNSASSGLRTLVVLPRRAFSSSSSSSSGKEERQLQEKVVEVQTTEGSLQAEAPAVVVAGPGTMSQTLLSLLMERKVQEAVRRVLNPEPGVSHRWWEEGTLLAVEACAARRKHADALALFEAWMNRAENVARQHPVVEVLQRALKGGPVSDRDIQRIQRSVWQCEGVTTALLCCTLVQLACKQAQAVNVDACLELVHTAEHALGAPSIYTVNALLAAWAAACRAEREAMRLKGEDENAQPMFPKMGGIDLALDRLNSASAPGSLPPYAAMCSFIEGCYALNVPDAAFRLARDAANGVEALKQRPAVFLRPFFATAIAHDDDVRAIGLLNVLYAAGELPAANDVGRLMHSAVARKRKAVAVRMYTDLRDAGGEPTEPMWSILLNAAHAGKDVELAKMVIADMMKWPNVSTDTLWTRAISTLCRAGKLAAAMEALEQMKTCSMPTAKALPPIAYCAGMQRKLQVMQQVLSQAPESDNYVHNRAIAGLLTNESGLASATMLYERMVAPGASPGADARTHATYCMGLISHNRKLEVLTVFKRLVEADSGLMLYSSPAASQRWCELIKLAVDRGHSQLAVQMIACLPTKLPADMEVALDRIMTAQQV